MLDAALMMMSANVSATQADGCPPQAHGNAHPKYAGYATYQTKDGLLMVGAWTNRQMAALYRVLGDTDRAIAVEQTSRAGIGNRCAEDTAFLRSTLPHKTADEWERILNDADVPAARVRRLDEALAHEQITSRTVLQSYPGAEREGAPNALPVAAYSYAHGGPTPGGAPPKVGEHTTEILAELGYDTAAIESLSKSGIVATQT